MLCPIALHYTMLHFLKAKWRVVFGLARFGLCGQIVAFSLAPSVDVLSSSGVTVGFETPFLKESSQFSVTGGTALGVKPKLWRINGHLKHFYPWPTTVARWYNTLLIISRSRVRARNHKRIIAKCTSPFNPKTVDTLISECPVYITQT
jgi:hypothetical protein